jgi:hypothetical protein
MARDPTSPPSRLGSRTTTSTKVLTTVHVLVCSCDLAGQHPYSLHLPQNLGDGAEDGNEGHRIQPLIFVPGRIPASFLMFVLFPVFVRVCLGAWAFCLLVFLSLFLVYLWHPQTAFGWQVADIVHDLPHLVLV